MNGRATVCKIFSFHAAHQLPNHDGDCARLHGHTYKMEVCCRGPIRPADGSSSEGMVMDFGRIKEVYRERIEPLVEHQDLNETLPVPRTTAENIASWAFGVFNAHLPGWVTKVRVWETATSYAEVGIYDS